jgi:hypothetical protein
MDSDSSDLVARYDPTTARPDITTPPDFGWGDFDFLFLSHTFIEIKASAPIASLGIIETDSRRARRFEQIKESGQQLFAKNVAHTTLVT